jgi:hypothetical protein
MMSENEIDKLFKDKLFVREFEIKESYIANLEVSLENRKGGRLKTSFFFLSFFLLVSVSIVGYFLLNSTNNLGINEETTLAPSENFHSILTEEAHQSNANTTIVSSATKTNKENSILPEKLASAKTTHHQQQLINTEKNKNLPKSNGVNPIKPSLIPSSFSTSRVKKKKNKAVKTAKIDKNSSIGRASQSLEDDRVLNNESLSNKTKNTATNLSPFNEESLANKTIKPQEASLKNQGDRLNDPENISLDHNTNNSLPKDSHQRVLKNVSSPTASESLATSLINTDDAENRSVDKSTTNSLQNDANQSTLKDVSPSTTIKSLENSNINTNNAENISLDNSTIIFSQNDSNQRVKNDSLPESEADSSVSVEKDSTQNLADHIKANPYATQEEEKNKPNTAYKKWNISIFAGPAMISKSISGTVSSNYLNKRKNEEKEITSVNYGVAASYFLSKNFNLSTGLNLLSYGENVEYSKIIKSTNDSSIISYTQVISQDTGISDTTYIPVYATQLINDTLLESQKRRNRYTYLHLPMMAGYQFNFNKLSVNIRVGGSIAFLIQEDGKNINTEMTGVESLERKKTFFNLIVSSSFSYPIKKIDVFLAPIYQFKSSNFLTDSNVKQRYSSVGINWGVSIKF